MSSPESSQSHPAIGWDFLSHWAPGLVYFDQAQYDKTRQPKRDNKILSLPEYFKIGKLVAVHGLKGELVLKHTLGKKSSLKGLTAFFVEERKNSFLPWFIESARIKNEEEVYLKPENVDTREAALKLNQKEIWVTETDFKKFAAKSAPASLLGYTIINKDEPLGEILEVIEQPHQLLCRLEIQGKEVLIPLHEETLQKADHRKKQVIVELPEGLLDIYL